ncbi:hypothetical protein DFH08DRAFT_157878 [Mycena albidolilacea]|uniref:Uncharacterized protein n=1 Tax=Mycena albidolilacea TaxID=1033008 RepID=A0AAD7A2G0_9AGAR|nr:hypothetical protein DFH08DRAFT_157878 [Mycena albidolilacea]
MRSATFKLPLRIRRRRSYLFRFCIGLLAFPSAKQVFHSRYHQQKVGRPSHVIFEAFHCHWFPEYSRYFGFGLSPHLQVAMLPAKVGRLPRAPLSSSKFRVKKGCLPDRWYLHHRTEIVARFIQLWVDISLLTSTFHLPLMHSRNSVSHSAFFQRHSSRDSHPSSS